MNRCIAFAIPLLLSTNVAFAGVIESHTTQPATLAPAPLFHAPDATLWDDVTGAGTPTAPVIDFTPGNLVLVADPINCIIIDAPDGTQSLQCDDQPGGTGGGAGTGNQVPAPSGLLLIMAFLGYAAWRQHSAQPALAVA